MPRISSYPADNTVTDTDLFIGSDAGDGLATKTYSAVSVADYLFGTGRFAATTYTHTQGTASTTWTITHNLERFPSITVIDTGGNQIFAQAQFIDENQIILTFSSAFTGKAYLN